MEERVLVLAAKPYDFIPAGESKAIQGVTLYYTSCKPIDARRGRGVEVIKQSVSLELAGELAAVPGVYQAGYSINTYNGKQELRVDALRFVEGFDLRGLVAEPAKVGK